MAGQQAPAIGEEVPETLVPSVGEDVSHLMSGSGSFDVQKQNAVMQANMAKQGEGRPFMQTHPKTRQVVRGALDTLPVAGGLIAGAAATPETIGAGTIPAGAVGVGIGRGARDLIAEYLGVEDQTSPLSKAARIALDSTIAAAMPVVTTGVKNVLTNTKSTLADVAEALSHPMKGGQKALDALAEYLRSSKAPLAPAQFADDISGQIERYAPNISGATSAPALTAEQRAAQAASGYATAPAPSVPSPISGPQGVPSSALGPEASARAATISAVRADPAKDVAVVKTLIANGVPPAAAVKQVAGDNPSKFGSLMTLYLRSRQVK